MVCGWHRFSVFDPNIQYIIIARISMYVHVCVCLSACGCVCACVCA